MYLIRVSWKGRGVSGVVCVWGGGGGGFLYFFIDDDDDELMLNVLRCHLTY